MSKIPRPTTRRVRLSLDGKPRPTGKQVRRRKMRATMGLKRR